MVDLKHYKAETELPETYSTGTLWKHQEAMLSFALSKPYSLLYAGMSTGKTLVALRYLEQFKGLRLVVCPATPMSVFAEDYATFWQAEQPYKVLALDKTAGSTDKKWQEILKHKDTDTAVILTYESAVRMPLHKINWAAVVFDEAHRLGMYDSKQSIMLCRELCNVPNKLAMTGTPFHDAYERAYGVWRIFDPVIPRRGYPQARIFGHYDQFKANFTIQRLHRTVPIITGYKNVDKLAQLLSPDMLRVRTEDVIELPDLVIKSYKFDLDKATKKAYTSLMDDALIELDGDAVLAPHILTRMVRGQQLIASGELVTEAGDTQTFNIKSRVDALLGILAELPKDEPVVIFTRFVKDVETVTKALRSRNKKASIGHLTGSRNDVDAWQKGSYQYLIANVASGSEGVRLVRASHLIVWSLSYSLKAYEQMIMRVRRAGQKAQRVFIHVLTAKGTIDQDIFKALEDKRKLINDLEKELKKC